MSDHRAPRQFQSLKQLQTYLHELEPQAGSSYSLQRMQQAVERLQHPERRYQVVHVGGTSGKGSTCTMIASILAAAGYSVGLYTSPSLRTPLERITVDGKAITERTAIRIVNQFWPMVTDLHLTHFETFTLLALQYFAERQVDYAVIEVGVGGKLDATNVVQPTVAIVTDVGLDHTELLGKTKQLIAHDKQAIIKPGCIGLTGSRLVKRGTYIPLDRAVIHQTTLLGTDFSYKTCKHLQLKMLGAYQVRNAILAIEATQRLGIASQAIRYGLRTAYQPGRFQVMVRKPLIIVDGAHNPQKMKAFIYSLKQIVPLQQKRVVALCAIKSTKDSQQILKLLLPIVDELVFTTFPRSYSLTALEQAVQSIDKQIKVEKIADPVKAYHYLRDHLQTNDVGVVTGSLYLIGKLLPKL